MALDTNLTPEIVNSFNVYIDGVKAIGTAPEITLPQITSETIDVSGSGILGKISAPNIGQFESIEQEVSFNLVYSSFVNVLSPKRQVNLTFRVAQQAVDKSLGYAYKGLRIVEIGRVKEFTPGKIPSLSFRRTSLSAAGQTWKSLNVKCGSCLKSSNRKCVKKSVNRAVSNMLRKGVA